jgi:hypothetical protein
MNTRKLFRASALCIAAMGLSAEAAPCKYAEGQVWEYNTRPQEAGSLLKIQRISVLDGKSVYHLSLIGVRFSRRDIAGVLPHIPVSKETLDASVTKRSSSTAAFPTTAVDEGIAEWQRAKGGVFTIPVSEILDIVDQQMSQASSAPAN